MLPSILCIRHNASKLDTTYTALHAFSCKFSWPTNVRYQLTACKYYVSSSGWYTYFWIAFLPLLVMSYQHTYRLNQQFSVVPWQCNCRWWLMLIETVLYTAASARSWDQATAYNDYSCHRNCEQQYSDRGADQTTRRAFLVQPTTSHAPSDSLHTLPGEFKLSDWSLCHIFRP